MKSAELVEKRDWTMLSHRIIFHGRRVCHARKPACGACTLAAMCPSYGTGPTEAAAAAKLLKGPRARELAVAGRGRPGPGAGRRRRHAGRPVRRPGSARWLAPSLLLVLAGCTRASRPRRPPPTPSPFGDCAALIDPPTHSAQAGRLRACRLRPGYASGPATASGRLPAARRGDARPRRRAGRWPPTCPI